jgi:hypothetical protein
MRKLQVLRLAGNSWSAPLDPAWGDIGTSWWLSSLQNLDLSDNPLGPSGGPVDVPLAWQNLPLQALNVSTGRCWHSGRQ